MSLLLTRGRRVNRHGYVCPARFYTCADKNALGKPVTTSDIARRGMTGSGMTGGRSRFEILETVQLPDELSRSGCVGRLTSMLNIAEAGAMGWTARDAVGLMQAALDSGEAYLRVWSEWP